MQEHVSQQPPPLPRQGIGAVVGAKVNHHLPREVQRGTTGQHHRDKDHHVGAKDDLRETDAGFAADPGRGDYGLGSVVVEFAALRRLVLLTPLADLLAKHQRWKLPATSNAVCHGLNKRVSAAVEVVGSRVPTRSPGRIRPGPRLVSRGGRMRPPLDAVSEWSSSSATCSPSADTAPACRE